MSTKKKFLDSSGVTELWSRILQEDYINNETLLAVINAIDEAKQDIVNNIIIEDVDNSDETLANILIDADTLEGYSSSDIFSYIDDKITQGGSGEIDILSYIVSDEEFQKMLDSIFS